MSNFLGGSRANDTTPPDVQLRIQTSVAGGPLPLGVGQQRSAGNLIEYTDFTSTPASNSGSGGKGIGGGSGGKDGNSGSYDYTAAVELAISAGPVLEIIQAWNNQTAQTLASLSLTSFLGDYEQTPWGYMSSLHPSQALAYRGVNKVSGVLALGTSSSLPNLTFETLYANSNVIPGAPDGDPAEWMEFLLTDPDNGIGFPSSALGDLSAYSNWARAAGLVVSDVLVNQQALSDYLNDLLEGTYSEAVVIDGLLTVVPRGMQAITANGYTYTPPGPVATLTADDFLPNTNSTGGATSSASTALNNDAVIWSRSRRSMAYNQQAVACSDRSNAYNANPQTANLLGEQAIFGLRAADAKSYTIFCLTSAALASAYYQLEEAQILNTATFTLGMKWARLTPMDIVSGIPAPNGVGTVSVLITEKTQNQDDLSFTIVATEYPDIPLALPVYSHEPNAGYVPDLLANPGPVNVPIIIEPPPGLLAMNSVNNPQIWIGASGGPNFGGATVEWSLDEATYGVAGFIALPARQGVLTAEFPAGTDPDTTNTLYVDLSESLQTLAGGTQADADSYRTLCYVDGEYIAYESATLESGDGFQFALGTYIRRGLFGSPITAHAAGSQFCRLDDRLLEIDLPLTPVSFIGKTIYLKFLAENAYGAAKQLAADVDVYAYTPGGTGASVLPPSDVTISTGVDIQADGTIQPFIVISWTPSPDTLFDQYEVQDRLHAGPGPWTSTIIGSTATSLKIKPVQVGVAYDAQVRAIRSAGPAGGPFYSAWAQDLNVVTTGKTTPPAAPTGLNVSGGYRQLNVSWTPSADTDIAFSTVKFGVTNSLASAAVGAQVSAANAVVTGLALGQEYYVWVYDTDTSGNVSTVLGPGTATTLGVESSDITGQIVQSQIAANSIAASNLISGLNVVQSVSTISAANHTTSLFAFAADTHLLYQWNGSAWVSTVSTLTSFPAVNITGQLTASQIASLAATQITGQLTASQIASLAATQITGQLTASQIASLAATQITGQLTASQIASLAATQITGQLTASQIASLAATQITGQLTAAQIASLTAAQLTGQITTTQIAPNSISTALLQAAAVESANIAAGAITASKLAIGAALIADPYFNDPSYWTLQGTPAAFFQGNTGVSQAMGGTNAFGINLSLMTAGESSYVIGPPQFIQVLPNTGYQLSCLAWSYAGATLPLTYRALIYAADQATVVAAPAITLPNSPPYAGTTGGALAQITFTTTSNAAYALVQAYVAPGETGQSGYWFVAGLNLQSTVGTTLIQDGAVTTNQIAANTITGGNIAANTITGANILAGTITATEIAASTITGSNIAAGTITAANIVAGTITGTLIAASTITGSNIAAGTITAANIVAGTITGTQIAGETITGANIAAGTITAANIEAGTITGTQIAASTITGSNIAAGTITAANILAGTITGTQIAAGTITTNQIAANTITGGDIAANTITGSNIAAGTITASNIEAGTIEAAQIATGGITGTNIAGSTITGSNIAALTITGANIAGGTITGDKITANFFQGYQYTASSGTGATAVMYGGVFTSGGLTYGPYFAHNDATGLTRAVLGHWGGADGLWVFDASGNVIFNVDQLGNGVVQTSNMAANAVTLTASASNSGGSCSASNTSSSPSAVTSTANLASITVTADGSTTLNIDISVQYGLALGGNYQYVSYLLLYRDGGNSGLLYIPGSAASSLATFVQDTPGAGSHTYTLVLYAYVADYTTPTGVTHQATAAAGPNTIQIQQFKR